MSPHMKDSPDTNSTHSYLKSNDTEFAESPEVVGHTQNCIDHKPIMQGEKGE